MGDCKMHISFEQAVERFGPTLYRLAFSYCHNREDAEDVVQEVFVKYLRAEPDFDAEEDLKRWLMTVTANTCRDLLKSAWYKRGRPAQLLQELPYTDGHTDLRLEMGRALAALAPKYSQVVYLYYYEEYSVRDIAQILRLSETAVRSRLDRARKQLKRQLGGDWLEG